jgi:hypothetical protein
MVKVMSNVSFSWMVISKELVTSPVAATAGEAPTRPTSAKASARTGMATVAVR